MEVSEMAKEWYVTHEGQQFGPVSIDDLKYEAERGELNPRVDMVWKQGMEDWIPSGQLEGLFEKNTEAEKKENAKETEVAPEFIPEESKQKRMLLHGKWGGVKRSTFIFLCYILPVIWVLGISFFAGKMQGKIDPELMPRLTLGLSLLPVVIILIALFQRLKNLGMSMAWFLGLLVPFLNMWLGYRLFACPEGYAVHKKLDGIGWALAIIYWLPVVLAIAFVVFAAVTLQQATETDPYRETIENYLRKIQDFKIQEPIPAK